MLDVFSRRTAFNIQRKQYCRKSNSSINNGEANSCPSPHLRKQNPQELFNDMGLSHIMNQ